MIIMNQLNYWWGAE